MLGVPNSSSGQFKTALVLRSQKRATLNPAEQSVMHQNNYHATDITLSVARYYNETLLSN